MIPRTIDDAWASADPTVCDRHGRDACEAPECLPRPNGRDHADEDARPALRARRALDVMQAPGAVEIVEGVLWADCLTVLAAESGAGKTFAALDLAAAIADGAPWHGRETLQGSVVYLPFEGALGRRMRAIHEHLGRRLDHLYEIPAREPLSPRVTRDGELRSVGELQAVAALDDLRAELAAAHRPPVVALIVDTARASMTGSEDSSEHVSAYLRAARRLLAVVPGAALLIVHHAGWQDGESPRKRERGSSTWRGNVDGTLYLEAGEYDGTLGTCPITLHTRKVRDGEEPPPLRLVRRRVELAGVLDRHGRPVTSCVVERDARSRADVEAAQQAAHAETERALDVAVLRAMQAGCTSIRAVRTHTAAKSDAVERAVGRVLGAGWAQPGKRGQPYTLTDAGLSQL